MAKVVEKRPDGTTVVEVPAVDGAALKVGASVDVVSCRARAFAGAALAVRRGRGQVPAVRDRRDQGCTERLYSARPGESDSLVPGARSVGDCRRQYRAGAGRQRRDVSIGTFLDLRYLIDSGRRPAQMLEDARSIGDGIIAATAVTAVTVALPLVTAR
jgi:hypothetical protein